MIRFYRVGASINRSNFLHFITNVRKFCSYASINLLKIQDFLSKALKLPNVRLNNEYLFKSTFYEVFIDVLTRQGPDDPGLEFIHQSRSLPFNQFNMIADNRDGFEAVFDH